MLTIEQCRELLGETPLSNSEICELRDGLYTWLNQLLDSYFAGQLPEQKL